MITDIMIPQAQQAAWLGLASRKNMTVTELERRELSLQAILLQPESDKAATLKNYRAEFTALQNFRKDFTGMIEKSLISPLMEFEKRCDPKVNAEYKSLEAAELAERLELERLRNQTLSIEQEKNEFRAHMLNEYEKQVAVYRIDLYNEIQAAQKAGADKDSIIATLQEIKPGILTRFSSMFITDADRLAIYQTVAKPDYDRILQEMISEIGKETKDDQIEFIMVEASDNIKVNTLMAKQATIELEKPKIKRNVEIELENSTEWATKVMSAFIGLDLYRFVKVKDIAKLTIAQMAKAIGDYTTSTGDEVEGFIYKEIIK